MNALFRLVGVAIVLSVASLDCTKANTSTKVLICNDPALLALDSKLGEAYEGTLAVVAPSSKHALINEQRNWLRYTRALCQNTACLQQTYSLRIAALARNERYIVSQTSCETPSGSTACQSVVRDRDPNIRITSFNQALIAQKTPGKIVGCTELLELPVGYANSNDSYGGYCILEEGSKRTAVKICNDDLFGRFAMQPVAPDDESEKDSIDFTSSECFGG